jgi:DNA-binding IclR family transcriptional regulator
MARPRSFQSDDADQGPRDKRQFVTAAARGLDVLQAFVPDGLPLGNQDIAARTGLPRPTVSRITYTLTELGYLVYSPEAEKYRLGPGILALSHAFGAGTKLEDVAHEPLQDLADATRGTVAIGQADQEHMVYLLLRRSVSKVMLRQDVGSRVPIATTAMGHAWLNTLPPARRDRVVDRIASGLGETSARFHETLARTRAEMETRGFCVMVGTWEQEISGAATAIALDDGQTVLGLNIGGPAFWLTSEALYGEIGTKLTETRDRLIADGITRLSLV